MTDDRRRALEAFTRNKNRSKIADQPKPKRDWLALGISIGALAISFATLSFSFILQRDHLSIVVGELPAVLRGKNGAVSLMFPFDPEITFINSGTRPAAITYFAATAKVLGRTAKKRIECNGQEFGDIYTLPVSLPTFVVKPGEIKLMKIGVPEKDKGDSISKRRLHGKARR